MVLRRKKILFVTTLFVVAVGYHTSHAQGFNGDKIAFTNFITRMYDNNPFEGVKVVEDYDDTYLISVVSLVPSSYPSESTMTRVAEIKSRAQASRFLNGADITLEMVVTTKDDGKGTVSTEMIERIHEGHFGHIKALELLTIIHKDGNTIYVYSIKLQDK